LILKTDVLDLRLERSLNPSLGLIWIEHSMNWALYGEQGKENSVIITDVKLIWKKYNQIPREIQKIQKDQADSDNNKTIF